MDDVDRAIVTLLRRDGRLTNQELAQHVGLTPAPCMRRVRRLEADGIITGYTATVDPTAVGRGLEVIIHVDLRAMDADTVSAFEGRIAAMDEVAELRRMFGRPDYLIGIQVKDLRAYELWLTSHLLCDPAVDHIESRITMKSIKT